MGKVVTRHLTYAWIEYGDPRDGAAFTDGLYNMGWKNAISGFPVKRDAFGIRAVDASHPLLPLRWRGSALMICPNERKDDHSYDGRPNPPLKDPIFEDFKKANDEDSFKEEIRKQNAFIANWVFSPGIKKISDSESHLTVDADTTDFVDMVTISGHGSGGNIWGGGEQAQLVNAVLYPLPPASDRLKYVIIASCSNVNAVNSEFWLGPLRRNRPIHGFLGYQGAYIGDENGAGIFKKFTNNLKADSGASNTILKVWRDANAADKQSKSSWAAVLHTSSAQNDTMAKWLAGQIEAPDQNGEVRWYQESNYPDGMILVHTPPDFTVNFFMGATKITVANKDHPDVGLFPSQKGALGVAKRTGTFATGDTFTIKFYYYRPGKDGMDLNALLTFDTPPDVDLKLLTDANKLDTTTHVDAVKIVFKKSGLSETKLPFTVNKDALKHYPLDGGNWHGYFFLEIVNPDDILAKPSPAAAALREP